MIYLDVFHGLNILKSYDYLEFFQLNQHSFLLSFWSGISNFQTIFAHNFLNCKCDLKNVCTDSFPKFNSSAIIQTVNRQESTKDYWCLMFVRRLTIVILEVFMALIQTFNSLEKSCFLQCIISLNIPQH